MLTQPVHVWVASDPGSQPSPGILLDWRQRSGEWEAFVLYVSYHLTYPVEEPHVHLQWLKGSLVSKR